MSRLQFNHTFMSGALYALIGVIETGALAFFIYLYFIDFFVTSNLPFFVASAALAYLYLLNLVSLFVQNCSICYDKDFNSWYRSHNAHKVTTVIINIISVLFNHKTRNLLFCKLFSFGIFSAKL
jgi:hypothetical protein